MSPADLSSFQSTFSLPQFSIFHDVGGYVNDTACLVELSNCQEANLDVQYIMATSGNVPTTFWYDPTNSYFVSFITQVAAQPAPPKVISISYGIAESAISQTVVKSFNTEAMKLSVQGVTIIASSGDDGAPSYTASSDNKCSYNPTFPASSPYVTAVGATQGVESNTEEIVCQSNKGCPATSGGGFSKYSAAPAFQTRFISKYFKYTSANGITTRSGYNAAGRGYPDVTLAGYNYLVVIGRTLAVVSGTSTAAPVFAGMVSLINSRLLDAGRPVLGWLNPKIYALNGSFANDITVGDNKCTSSSSVCCIQGFTATPGWDPVSGFGSVDYEKLCNALAEGLVCSSALSFAGGAQVASLVSIALAVGLFLYL
eukprot:gene36285-biopygen123